MAESKEGRDFSLAAPVSNRKPSVFLPMVNVPVSSADGAHALFPSSTRIYLTGSRPDLRVPFRQIALSPTNRPDGSVEGNPPVNVYDTSGAWGDPAFHGDIERGLPPVRDLAQLRANQQQLVNA